MWVPLFQETSICHYISTSTLYIIHIPYINIISIHQDHSNLRDKTDTELLAIGVVCSNALIGRAVKSRRWGVFPVRQTPLMKGKGNLFNTIQQRKQQWGYSDSNMIQLINYGWLLIQRLYYPTYIGDIIIQRDHEHQPHHHHHQHHQ